MAALCLAALAGAGTAETLDQALEAALAADARTAASQHQIAAAQAGQSAARGLGLPKVALEAVYERLSDEPAFRIHISPLPATALPFAQRESAVVHAGVSLPLYTSGRLTHAAGAADAALEAAQADARRIRQDVRLGAAEAYVSVLRAQRLLEVAESGVTTLQAHLRDVTAFLERGLVARSDALAARAAAAAAEQDRLRAATALDIAQATYNRGLGRALTQPVQLDELVATAGPAAPAPGTEVPPAPVERAELSGLAHQARALQEQAQATRAAGRPQVLLSGGYSAVQNHYLARENIWNIGVGLRWELFDGGVSQSQADALAARAQAVTALRSDLESQIALQLRASRLMLEESRQRIPVAATAVEQAEENLRVARDRYQSGVGTHTEVLDAEALRMKSRNNHFNALYDQALAGLRLRRAQDAL
jgi:outer membrane protein TolC